MSTVELCLWLGTLAAGVLGISLIACLLLRGVAGSSWVLLAAIPPGLVLMFLSVVFSERLFTHVATVNVLAKHGLVPLAAFAAAIQLILLQHLRSRKTGRWQGWGWAAFVGWQFLMLMAATSCFYRLALPQSIGVEADGSVELTEAPQIVLLTDRGNRVPVFRVVTDMQVHRDVRRVDAAALGYETALIRQATPDFRANCHGWVFTNGYHLLRGEGVETILRDNSYQLVEQPYAGDIIVYRDALGRIVHTGLVRLVTDDGLVLIESKWGIGGRFIHQPQDQAYSDSYHYYHTSRGSHLLAGIPDDGVNSTASKSHGPAHGPAPAG